MGYAEISSKAVLNVVMKVISPAATDTFNVQNVVMSMYSGGIVRESAALPAPAAK